MLLTLRYIVFFMLCLLLGNGVMLAVIQLGAFLGGRVLAMPPEKIGVGIVLAIFVLAGFHFGEWLMRDFRKLVVGE